MKKALLVIALLTIPVFGQASKDSPVVDKVEQKPIEIQPEMQEPIRNANRDIELAQLKKTNIILQLRLILKIPNDYNYDENSMSFKPPTPKKEIEKKEKP